MPPDEPASVSTGQPVSEMTVIVAGGTCTANSNTLQAGDVKVTFNIKDTNNDLFALTIFDLLPGNDIVDLMMTTIGDAPIWASILLLRELGPGKSTSYNLTIDKGPVYVICWSKPPDPANGNAGPIEVDE